MMKWANQSSWNNKEEWKKTKRLLSEEQTVIVYDLETTGLSPVNDRFIELGAAKYFVKDNVWTLKDELSFLVNPQVPLSEKIIELTGICNKDLENQPTESEWFSQIHNFFEGAVIAGYNNTRFDNLFFEEYYARQGFRFMPKGNIDAYLLAKQSGFYKELPNCKLSTIGNYYGLDFTAHRALGDVKATAELIRIMVAEYTESEQNAKPNPYMIPAKVRRVSYWEGFRGFSRIYVETSAGTVYYDLRSTLWGGKDVDINTLDMESVQSQVLTLTRTDNMQEFSKFRTGIMA